MTLLTDGIRAAVGREVVYTAPEPLGRAVIRYFARATGDDDPRHLAGEVAPPTLVCETNQFTDVPRDADGYAGHGWHLDVPGTRLVRGGNRYILHRSVRPDDVVTTRWRIADVAERSTSRGQAMLVVTSVAEYSAADRELLAENTETLLYVAQGRSGLPRVDSATGRPQQGDSAANRPDVPPLETTITLADMVAYAGATWDWHRLHYDAAYVAERGLPGPVVDGQVFGALLARQLRAGLGPGARLRRMTIRFASPVYAGETVRCCSTVTGTDGGLVTLDCRVDVVGARARTAVGPAGATVELT